MSVSCKEFYYFQVVLKCLPYIECTPFLPGIVVPFGLSVKIIFVTGSVATAVDSVALIVDSVALAVEDRIGCFIVVAMIVGKMVFVVELAVESGLASGALVILTAAALSVSFSAGTWKTNSALKIKQKNNILEHITTVESCPKMSECIFCKLCLLV